MFHAGLIAHNILPPRLRLDYDPGLDAEGLDVMALVLTPALLSGLAGNIVGLERPRMSPPLASFGAEGSVGGVLQGDPQNQGLLAHPLRWASTSQYPASMDDVLKYEPYSWGMS